ncbi:MAG TPA: NmrA family NAD(P)-binding protein, partial [Polyangiaceae bacterium]
HIVWSTLEDTRTTLPISDERMPVLQGKYNVPHFDGKEEADAAFRDAGVPTTYLRTAFYWENLIYFGLGPQRGEDGVLAITYPMGDKRLPAIGAEDIGKIAYGIFKRGDELIGKTISVAGEHLTGSQMAEKLSKALGEEVRYNEVDPDTFRSFGFPGADEIGTCSTGSATSRPSTWAHAISTSRAHSIRSSRTSTPGSARTPS